MSDSNELIHLTGSQEILFSENDNCLARITAMGQAHLRGSWFKLETAQSVSRIGLGMALIHSGLAVLRNEERISADELRDTLNLVEDFLEQSHPTEPKTPQYPF